MSRTISIFLFNEKIKPGSPVFHTVLPALGESAWQAPALAGPRFPHLPERLRADCPGSPSSCCQRGISDSAQEPRVDPLPQLGCPCRYPRAHAHACIHVRHTCAHTPASPRDRACCSTPRAHTRTHVHTLSDHSELGNGDHAPSGRRLQI